MNRGTYTVANGMIAQQERLDVISHNLANANTTGFKADGLSFGDMMVRTMADDGGYGDPIAVLSSGPESKVSQTDFSEGGSDRTDNPLDMRLGGRTVAMFAVQHGDKVLYTRDGAFTVAPNGDLVTKAGDAVLDAQNRPIQGLSGPIASQGDGRFKVGSSTFEVGRFVGSFKKDEDGGGLYDALGDVHAPRTGEDVRFASGELETSNVNPVSAMVEMIAVQRAYEMAQKMIQSQDESTGRLAEAMS